MSTVIVLQSAYPDMKAFNNLMEALAKPYDEKIGEYGSWDKYYENTEEFIKDCEYQFKNTSSVSKDELNQALANEDCVIAEDGTIWRKNSALAYDLSADFHENLTAEADKIENYIFSYKDALKKAEAEGCPLDMLIHVTHDYHIYFDTDEEEYELCEDEPWPFKDDTPVYVLYI